MKQPIKLKNGRLSIRDVSLEDADILCRWWNNGQLMIHVGFPRGLGTDIQKVRRQLSSPESGSHLCLLELDGRPVGEISYRDKGNHVAFIGVKVCDLDEQGKGHGTNFIRMFLGYLFQDLHFKKVTLDTLLSNKRAQNVYEKIGFRRVGVSHGTWTDQLGELQAGVDYELDKADFLQ